jgi:CheY-like chemotaxis protein
LNSAPGMGTSVMIAIPYRREVAASILHQRPMLDLIRAHDLPAIPGRPREVLFGSCWPTITRWSARGYVASSIRMKTSLVGEAANGVEAVSLTEALKQHVVVMDLNMPLMDGIEATHRIKQSTPLIVVIGPSVRNDRETEEAMRQAGASGYLTKESAAKQRHQAICELLQHATPLGS